MIILFRKSRILRFFTFHNVPFIEGQTANSHFCPVVQNWNLKFQLKIANNYGHVRVNIATHKIEFDMFE